MAPCCQISLDSFVLLFLIITTWSIMCGTPVQGGGDDCFLRPVIHVLQQPGCVPKPIPSFACQGSCASYVQLVGYSEFHDSCYQRFSLFIVHLISGLKLNKSC